MHTLVVHALPEAQQQLLAQRVSDLPGTPKRISGILGGVTVAEILQLTLKEVRRLGPADNHRQRLGPKRLETLKMALQEGGVAELGGGIAIPSEWYELLIVGMRPEEALQELNWTKNHYEAFSLDSLRLEAEIALEDIAADSSRKRFDEFCAHLALVKMAQAQIN